MGGRYGVAGVGAAGIGGASALSGVVREQEVRRASQMAGEGGAMRQSPRGGMERMSAVRRA